MEPDDRLRQDVSFRDRLRGTEPVLATFSIVPSVELVEMSVLAGFDAVILDLEHGPFDVAELRALVPAVRSRGGEPLVRVRSAEGGSIGAVLDVGAAGVIVPNVTSRAAAEAAVSAARFPPEGRRGANPWVRSADFTSGPEYYERANREVVVLAMVEGLEGVDAVDEILAVAGLDAVFLGPVDLANALGVAGEPEHPRVVETVAAVIERAEQRGMGVAVFAPDPPAARRWLGRGVNLVAVGEDTLHVMAALRAVVQAVRSPD